MAEEDNKKITYELSEGISTLSRLLDAVVPLRKTQKILYNENDKLKSFINAIPVEYCGWDKNGAQAISKNFCALLESKSIESFIDLQNALTPADAASLETLYNRLQNNSENFEVNIQTAKSHKNIKLIGRYTLLDDSTDKFFVIWAEDISNFIEAMSASMQAAHNAEFREQEMTSSLNALPFPVWLRNKNLDLTWCNKFYSTIVDDSNAAIIADQKDIPLLDKNKKPINTKLLSQQSLVKGETCITEGRVILDGKRSLIEVRSIPLKNEDIILNLGIDITREEELKETQKQLVNSYHEAMEQLSTAIAMFDADTRLEFYNSAYEQVTGISASWLNTKPRIIELIDKMRELRKLPEQADYKQYKQAWLDRFTSLMQPLEEVQYLPDETVSRMIIVPRPLGGLMITMEDVTSHMQLETSYNTLMEVQKETMNNLTEGIAVFGEDGRIKLYNHSFSTIWGIMPETLSNTPHISKIIDSLKIDTRHEKKLNAIKQTLRSCALEREPQKGRIEKPDGRIIEYSSVPLPDGNILNAYFDITDSIKVEQALKDKNEALSAAEKLKTDFIANVSYQLRTPLNSIMGFAEMLEHEYMGALNEKQHEYMGNILEASTRLKSLINDILDLSSIEAGQMELSYSPVNVKKLIENVVDITQTWGRKQNIEMSVSCKQDFTFDADEGRIKQILLNLISNAFNFSKEKGGLVKISAYTENNMAIIQVEDNGIGIPSEDLERVFTPFDKIHSGKTTNRSGAGLGLTLVKNIADLHKGKVRIESKSGEGTNVFVSIPLKKV